MTLENMSNAEKIRISPGQLIDFEAHPSAFAAQTYINSLSRADLMRCQESFASASLSGNRLADICGETLRRLLGGEPVSDRYLLGLAWQLKYLQEETNVGKT